MLKPSRNRFYALLTAFLLLGTPILHLHAAEPTQAARFATLDTKATRFAEFGEWASASAMLTLMLDLCPDSASLYARAIIAEGMRQRPQPQQQLLNTALEHGVPIDSLISGVRTRSISLGRADLYETFLSNIPQNHPWLKRTIDAYLLQYYIFRRNPQGIITYAGIMLQGLPDNQQYLADLASGYTLAGEYAQAMDTYHRILAINPDNLTALLAIGNYLHLTGHPHQARPYLQRANNIAPTPYLTNLLTP